MRKVIKIRGGFPKEEAALTLLSLALRQAAKKWTMPLGESGRHAFFSNDLHNLLGKIDQRQRGLVLYLAAKVAHKQKQ